MRIDVIGGRDERLLDRPRRRPSAAGSAATRLVVGARRPRAAERLLPDDRAGRLVVDVEVPRREPQPRRCARSIAARSCAKTAPVSAYGARRSTSVEHRRRTSASSIDVHATGSARRYSVANDRRAGRRTAAPSAGRSSPRCRRIRRRQRPSRRSRRWRVRSRRRSCRTRGRSITAPPKLDRSVTSP